MGDRCHMIVICREEDASKFQELGFEIESFSGLNVEGVVEMVDEEANYAHHGELPEDIPYICRNSAGSTYGPGEIACDGQSRTETEVGFEGDGYVVAFSRGVHPAPHPFSLTQIIAHIQMVKKVEEMLGLNKKEAL